MVKVFAFFLILESKEGLEEEQVRAHTCSLDIFSSANVQSEDFCSGRGALSSCVGKLQHIISCIQYTGEMVSGCIGFQFCHMGGGIILGVNPCGHLVFVITDQFQIYVTLGCQGKRKISGIFVGIKTIIH